MDKIDILMWIIGIGFAFNFGILAIMWNTIWNTLNTRFDRIEHKIEKLDDKFLNVDRRLWRLEGAFASSQKQNNGYPAFLFFPFC